MVSLIQKTSIKWLAKRLREKLKMRKIIIYYKIMLIIDHEKLENNLFKIQFVKQRIDKIEDFCTCDIAVKCRKQECWLTRF